MKELRLLREGETNEIMGSLLIKNSSVNSENVMPSTTYVSNDTLRNIHRNTTHKGETS